MRNTLDWSGRPDLLYRFLYAFLRGVLRLTGTRWYVDGVENVPASGAAVLVANHTNYLDFGWAALPPWRHRRTVRFLCKKGIFELPVLGWAMRNMDQIVVDRFAGTASYRRALQELAAGRLVGVFPEATISRALTLKPFESGAAALAVARSVPLIPLVSFGGHRILGVDGHWSLTGKPVVILVGAPLHPDEIAPTGPRPARVATVNQVLRERMSELLDEAQRRYPDRPRRATDWWWLPRHLGGTAPTPEEAAIVDAAKRKD